MNTRTWASWGSDTFSSFVSGIQTSYSNVSSALHTALSYDFVQKYGLQFWEGFTRVLDPNNVTKIITSPHTREILAESFKSNVICYLSLGLLWEVTSNGISQILPIESTWAGYSLGMTVSSFAAIGMTTILIHRLYDNTMLNMVLVKKVTDENPVNKYYPACRHDSGALIKAGLLSPIYLSTNVISIWAASYLPVLRWLAPIGYAHVYGQSFAELLYSAAGNCSKDRAKELAKNNGYSLGLGASFYITEQVIAWLLYRYTGASSVFISNAISSAIYPYFVTSTLLRDRPLKSHEEGIDLSYFHRYLIDHMITVVSQKIFPLLQNNNKKIEWERLGKKTLEILNFQPIRFAAKIFSYDIYGDWRSPSNFVLNKPNKLVLNTYYDMTQKKIQEVIDLREKPLRQTKLVDIPQAILAPLVPKLPNIITRRVGVSDEFKKVIEAIFSDWVKDPLASLQRFLKTIRKIQLQSEINIVNTKNNIPMPKSFNQHTENKVSKSVVPEKPTLTIANVKNNLLFNKQENYIRSEKHIFLLKLKEYVTKSSWNNKGATLFGVCVPDTIQTLRGLLKPLHECSSENEVNHVFSEIYQLDTFKFYAKKQSRHPDVEKFYGKIAAKIEEIEKKQDHSFFNYSK